MILIDAHSLGSKAHFAGQSEGNEYLFFGMVSKIVKAHQEKYGLPVFCFDGRDNWRKKQYPEYKATRSITPDRIEYLRKLYRSLNVSCDVIGMIGYEADDIVGSLSRNPGTHLVVSGDQDLFQLVNENVQMLYVPSKFKDRKLFTVDEVHKKLGIYPEQLPCYKGLAGDTGDNIKGVRGIGAKTALKLLTEYHNLDAIYDNLENLPQRGKLEGQEQMARLSKAVGTIVTTLELTPKNVYNLYTAKENYRLNYGS